MAFPTTDVRVETGMPGLFTKDFHLDTTLKQGCPMMGDHAVQLHEFAGIRPANGWNRAGPAQVTAPGGAEQAALLMVAAPVVVSVEILAFRSSRCSHFPMIELPQS